MFCELRVEDFDAFMVLLNKNSQHFGELFLCAAGVAINPQGLQLGEFGKHDSNKVGILYLAAE